MSTVAFTFGNFNPPNKSHRNVLTKVKEVARKRGIEYHIIVSSVCDSNTNPLNYYDKVNFMKQMFPDVFIDYEPPDVYITSMIDACVYLYKKGYRNIVCVCGEGKKNRIDFILNSYNNKKSKFGFYQFESIKILTCDTDEYSTRDMRESAKRENYDEFKDGLPQDFDARIIYQHTKRRLK